ncbi:MAG: geranylgeranylglycerol-phosphate geranylgeranyltransferase [bacterium]|nr:geranylgeranylglycerol-phosphate geranylgeranyltransferase [bacterium]
MLVLVHPSHGDRLAGLLALTRPTNCAITSLSVLLGGWLGTAELSAPLIIAALSASLIAGGGNTLNDLCGIREDRINKPQRPMPSGRVSRAEAIALFFFLTSIGLFAGFLLPMPAPGFALFAVFGLVVYNFWLKRRVLIGNLVIGILGGSAFLYGGYAVQSYVSARWPALFAALFHVGREILKDMQDTPGDRLISGSTVPLSWGRPTARIWVAAVYVSLMLMTPLPALLGSFGRIYLAIVSLLNLILIYVLIQLWSDDSPRALQHLSQILKVCMVIGMGAFFFDRTWP